MKWYNCACEKWSLCEPGLKAKKQGYKIEILDYTIGWKRDHIGWYVGIEKNNFAWNSLWSNIWFKNIEDAQKWCESQDFAKLQEDYEMAKREESQCQS